MAAAFVLYCVVACLVICVIVCCFFLGGGGLTTPTGICLLLSLHQHCVFNWFDGFLLV